MNKKFEVGCNYIAIFTDNDIMSNTTKYYFHCKAVEDNEVYLTYYQKEVYCPTTETLVITKYNKPQLIIREIDTNDSNDEFIMFNLGYNGSDEIILNACWDLDIE